MGFDFRRLFESAPGRYVVLAPDLTIVAATDSYVAAVMQPRDALIGRGLFDVFLDNPGHVAAGGVKNLRAFLDRVSISKQKQTMPVQRYDIRRVDEEGPEERYWRPSATPVLDERGELQFIIVAVDDITDLVQLQRRTEQNDRAAADAIQDEHQRLVESNNALESTNEELEAFCYSVAHDLRAPLRGIQGFSQALVEDYATAIDQKGQDYLLRVSSAALRMSDLIDDLLNLSRISRSPVSRIRVDLSAIAREIALDLEHRHNRHVRVTIADGLTATADPRLVRIALENLLGNAFKFTSKTEAAQVEFGSTVIEGVTAFFVRDNGAGFEETHATKMFAPFQRLHSEREFPGTGIGLATVQRVVRRHGGRTWAKGAVDRGAVFYFTLPD